MLTIYRSKKTASQHKKGRILRTHFRKSMFQIVDSTFSASKEVFFYKWIIFQNKKEKKKFRIINEMFERANQNSKAQCVTKLIPFPLALVDKSSIGGEGG